MVYKKANVNIFYRAATGWINIAGYYSATETDTMDIYLSETAVGDDCRTNSG